MLTPHPILLHNIPDEEIFADLHRAAAQHPGHHLSLAAYSKLGRFSPDAVRHRFHTWNSALAKARLPVEQNPLLLHSPSLFQQMERIWKKSARQPQCKDYQLIPRAPTYATYIARFGSWQNALQAFVTWANSRPLTAKQKIHLYSTPENPHPPKTSHAQHPPPLRNPPPRQLQMRPMWPLTSKRTWRYLLHLDHIKPWSPGGETVYENLQTLCESCNLGKATLQ